MRNGLIFIAIVLLSACKKNKSEPVTIDHSAHQVKLVSGYADSVNAGIIPKDTLKGSPVRTTMSNVGSNHVHIRYGSPGVRDRVIWGGLVAYNEVWSTGAHMATTVQFSAAVSINGVSIPAGKYGLFTIPNKEKWVLILNKNWNQHLADEYTPKDDVARIPITPEKQVYATQRLTYTINKISEVEGEILLMWEFIKLVIPFKNEM